MWMDLKNVIQSDVKSEREKYHILMRHYFASKGPSSQGYDFSCGQVWMWELDCEEGWAPKNWCFWTVVLEKTLESPLDCKEIQLVHSEGDQPWDFFGRNDAEAETPVLWPPHAKSCLIGKDSDAGRDWGQEKGTTEDEMSGWHHWLDGLESEWTPGVGDGQGGLACCNSWGRKESDTTERLNWTELNAYMWDLEKFYRWPHLQSRNRDTDVQNKRMDIKREEGSGRNGETGIDIYTIYTHLCVK